MPPLMQRMDSPTACVTNCTMPTADKSNHSAAGMLHPHCCATFSLYITLRGPIPPKTFAPSCWEILTLTTKKSFSGPPNQLLQWHNWCTYTELLLLLVMYEKLTRTYIGARTTHNLHCAKFSCGLAKTSRIRQKSTIGSTMYKLVARFQQCMISLRIH